MPLPNPPTALIADDERLMREQLRLRLAQCWPELQIVAEAENGGEAVELAAAHCPQIAFLDIRMPVLTGVEAAGQIDDGIHKVFVTAYDEYAIEAFERGAIDYLLKPVDPARLEKCVARLKKLLTGQATPAQDTAVLAQLAAQLRTALPAQPALKWIQASVGDRLEFIATDEVLFFQAADKYSRVVRPQGEVLIRKPIYELLAELDPDQFWQIHRSTIVNVRAIVDLSRDIRGHLMMRLKSCDEKLEVSRTFAHRFKQM